ncbi:uncharacterized protein [Nicotiana sylvestris]|uniref:uncharacterized protein n=1 Tax=Nicotiana sylvestris TaxID=4096 RepID=UPI00388CBF3A
MNGALTWYSLLPEHSIDSFEMLADSFIKDHAGARKVQARKTNIFRNAQGESELLREFIRKEMMLLTIVPDEWAAKAFTKGLNQRTFDASQKLKETLAKGWYQEKNKEKSKDDFDIDRRPSRVELVSAMRNIKERRFLKPMRSDPSQRDSNLWCEYHGTNGHRTRDCRHPREEVATLLKNDHLMEFLSDQAKNNYGCSSDNTKPSKARDDPSRLMINMIFGGNEINGVTLSAAKKIKVSVAHSKRLRRVLVDPESSRNIIQWSVLEKAKLT